MSFETKPIAAVVTNWRTNSHADVLLARILEPETWGHKQPFSLKLESIYFDQTDPNDIGRALCEKHGVKVASTIKEAVSIGTKTVPVEGVLIIGEHGSYAENQRKQTLYPRRRLFDEVINAFRVLGRRVPVFSDKHLSYEWPFCRWMVDLARHEGVPFMAGSSLPVAWRLPEFTIPIGSELTGAFGLGYAHPDHYGFHALETLQCMVERRKGGETGVASVQCLSGKDNVWNNPDKFAWPRDLFESILPHRQAFDPKAGPITQRDDDLMYLIRYKDGLNAAVGMIQSVGECFAFAGRYQEHDRIAATVFALERGRPFGHFGYLLRAIEHMIHTGKPAYPVERTLLTSGMLAALLQSRYEGGTLIKTPHLAELRYTPVEWPHAPAPFATPA